MDIFFHAHFETIKKLWYIIRSSCRPDGCAAGKKRDSMPKIQLRTLTLPLQGVAYSDEHFWSTLATVKYVGDDVEKNPVLLTRGQSKVESNARGHRLTFTRWRDRLGFAGCLYSSLDGQNHREGHKMALQFRSE